MVGALQGAFRPSGELNIPTQAASDYISKQGQVTATDPTKRQRDVTSIVNKLTSLGVSEKRALDTAQKFLGGSDDVPLGIGLADFTPMGIVYGADEAVRDYGLAEGALEKSIAVGVGGLSLLEAYPLTKTMVRPVKNFLKNLGNKSPSETRPKFITDVPTEEWLAGKIEARKEEGVNEFGVPRTGVVTGYYKDNVTLPVSELKKLKGVRGEQQNVRKESLDWLTNHMRKTGKLPMANNKEYPPFVTIGYDGVPYVSEGNHRIMAADKLGWETMPVELRYFEGGERKAEGVFDPSKFGAVNVDKTKYD